MKPLKPWQKWVLAGAIVLILAGIGFFIYLRSFRNKPQTTPPTVQVPENTAPSQPAPTTPQTPQTTLFYPTSNYDQRITFRPFGMYVTPAQQAEPCGASFRGYHTADDLETFSNEKNVAVPVFAISDSTVRQIGNVAGYGGLIVLETTINNQSYTIYYGHIALSSTNLHTGESVKAGEKLANLGAECSLQTDGERKHLHFGIHKGSAIDVRGYVPITSQLNAWINPKTFLMQNAAKEE